MYMNTAELGVYRISSFQLYLNMLHQQMLLY